MLGEGREEEAAFGCLQSVLWGRCRPVLITNLIIIIHVNVHIYLYLLTQLKAVVSDTELHVFGRFKKNIYHVAMVTTSCICSRELVSYYVVIHYYAY